MYVSHIYYSNIVMFQPKRLHSKFEEGQTKFEGDVTVVKVKEWIPKASLSLCSHRTPDNADKIAKPSVVAYYDVDYIKNIKGTNYWRNR